MLYLSRLHYEKRVPSQDDDYRLQGQARYLQGATLHWSQYKQPSADWDHDHCEFCWKTLAEPASGCIHAEFSGYTTDDQYRWICKSCFDDFKERFEWKVSKAAGEVAEE